MKISSLEIPILAAAAATAVLCCMALPSNDACDGVATTGDSNEVVEVCDFEFLLSAGEILGTTQEELEIYEYDNSNSGRETYFPFSVDRAITESSEFVYDPSLTITAEDSVQLPFVSNGNI